MQDKMWSLGFDESYVESSYEYRPGETRPYDFPDDVQLALTFELDRDLRVIKRKVYSLMDWLGDIGGLSGSLYALFTAAVMIF